MRKFILILSLILSFEAFAEQAPQKFQNPIFNNKLYSGGKKVFSHDILITPTSITDYDDSKENAECEYITENEKAILLKCNEPHTLYEGVFRAYRLFFVKYKDEWSDGTKDCNVWECLIILDDKGMPKTYQSKFAPIYVSKIFNCADEKNYYDEHFNYEKIDCQKEYEDRNWQKYIPGRWEDMKWS